MPLLRRYILLLLTLLSFTLQAQQYPVDIQVFVTPPYPQSLRGYADTFEQKIQAHFLLKDLSTAGRPFALRFSLENFQGQTIAQTPDYITPYLVNLSPGVRRTLTNIDFKSLLRYENLYGINEATYNGLLPEGTYFIGLSLYDVATGRPVSNKGRAMIQVRRYSPPVLTMPQKGEVLTKKNAFQNILFQWMPRDIAPFMQYEFTLKEVWDLALVPEEAFMSGRLVYQTKTNAPALQYTNMMPILLENKRYVWQVRALTNNPANPNEQSYFRNNGNSETFYFDLVSNCEAPRMLTAMTESTSAQLRWSAQAMMPNQEYPYKVMYRERGKSWKSQKVSMPYAKVIGLKRGRTYIYKVGVACGLNAANSTSVFGEDSYVYSTEQEFTTTEQIDEKSQVQCGVKPEIRIKNTEPLQDNLYPNTTFTAGDFPVTVLNATGSNGIYSGEGYVKVPYLQDTKIKVVFNGIKLNTERQLIDGKLVTTYDETERNVVDISSWQQAETALNNSLKQQEKIAEEVEKLEKELSKDKITQQEFQQKIEEQNKRWQQEVAKTDKIIDYIATTPAISDREKQELKNIQQENKKGNTENLSSKKLKTATKSNEKIVSVAKDVSKREKANIAEINKQLDDYAQKGNPSKKWIEKKGKFGRVQIDYEAYAEYPFGTMFRLKNNVIIYHTNYNVKETTYTSDPGHERFYIYGADIKDWVEFVPENRKFKRGDMPKLMKEIVFTTVDFWIPLENGKILVSGKSIDEKDKSRTVAAGLFIIEISAGKILKIVKAGAKVVGKGIEFLGEKTVKFIVKNADKVELLNKKLIQELREKGVKFTEENLEFITKNIDGMIIFLEKGSKASGLEHILSRHWKEGELMRFFTSQSEMIENIYTTISKNKYIEKIIDKNGRLSYIYQIITREGLKKINLAVGNNGYIVTLYIK